MPRRVVRLGPGDAAELAAPCGSCTFWQLDPARRRDCDDATRRLADWIDRTGTDWGTCGLVLRVDEQPAGHVLYAPPVLVPGAGQFPTAPASPEAVLLVQLRVRPEFQGGGVGKVLFQAMAKDLIKREAARVVEAFGSARPTDCVLPAGYLTALGFREHRGHPTVSRYRRDLRSALTWREEFEAAADLLFKPVRSPAPETRQDSPVTAWRSSENRSTPVFGSTSGAR